MAGTFTVWAALDERIRDTIDTRRWDINQTERNLAGLTVPASTQSLTTVSVTAPDGKIVRSVRISMLTGGGRVYRVTRGMPDDISQAPALIKEMTLELHRLESAITLGKA